MPAILSNTFVNVEGLNYNFDYIMVPRAGKTTYNFYAAAVGYDNKKPRPADWICVKMSADNYIVYSPVQPFILAADPVAQLVTFADYEPADKRAKFKKVKTLMEISPGIWPATPTPGQALIATQLDIDAIARIMEEQEEAAQQEKKAAEEKKVAEEKKIAEEKKAAEEKKKVPIVKPIDLEETIKKVLDTALDKVMTVKKETEKNESLTKLDKMNPVKKEEPKSEDQIRKEVAAEYEERARRQRNDEDYRRRQRYYRSPDRRRYDDHRSSTREKSPEKKSKETEMMELIRQGFDKLANSKPTEPEPETTEQKILRQQQQQLALLQQQQQQIQMQQQQLHQMKPHRMFGVPSPDLATLLPYPGTSQQYRGANKKRHSLDRSLEWSTASPEVTPERTRKVSAQQQPWMQPRYQPDDQRYDGPYNY